MDEASAPIRSAPDPVHKIADTRSVTFHMQTCQVYSKSFHLRVSSAAGGFGGWVDCARLHVKRAATVELYGRATCIARLGDMANASGFCDQDQLITELICAVICYLSLAMVPVG
jgi:hypothetical protein